jgi:hypothetical protein
MTFMWAPSRAPNQKRSSGSALILFFSAIALLVHLLTNGRYGYFRDELYYIACARHLDLGYVDQPSLSILILRLSQLLPGDSLFAIRLVPALAGAAIVVLTGIIAREMGGRAWAIALACAGSLCALFNLAVGNFFSMNAFEPPFGMGAVYLLVRIINGGPRTETSHTEALPQIFADQFGWEQMVGSIAHVYHHLWPEDEKRAAIFCQKLWRGWSDRFFLDQSSSYHPRFPGIRIIFYGDLAIGLAKSFWC